MRKPHPALGLVLLLANVIVLRHLLARLADMAVMVDSPTVLVGEWSLPVVASCIQLAGAWMVATASHRRLTAIVIYVTSGLVGWLVEGLLGGGYFANGVIRLAGPVILLGSLVLMRSRDDRDELGPRIEGSTILWIFGFASLASWLVEALDSVATKGQLGTEWFETLLQVVGLAGALVMLYAARAVRHGSVSAARTAMWIYLLGYPCVWALVTVLAIALRLARSGPDAGFAISATPVLVIPLLGLVRIVLEPLVICAYVRRGLLRPSTSSHVLPRAPQVLAWLATWCVPPLLLDTLGAARDAEAVGGLFPTLVVTLLASLTVGMILTAVAALHEHRATTPLAIASVAVAAILSGVMGVWLYLAVEGPTFLGSGGVRRELQHLPLWSMAVLITTLVMIAWTHRRGRVR